MNPEESQHRYTHFASTQVILPDQMNSEFHCVSCHKTQLLFFATAIFASARRLILHH